MAAAPFLYKRNRFAAALDQSVLPLCRPGDGLEVPQAASLRGRMGLLQAHSPGSGAPARAGAGHPASATRIARRTDWPRRERGEPAEPPRCRGEEGIYSRRARTRGSAPRFPSPRFAAAGAAAAAAAVAAAQAPQPAALPPGPPASLLAPPPAAAAPQPPAARPTRPPSGTARPPPRAYLPSPAPPLPTPPPPGRGILAGH